MAETGANTGNPIRRHRRAHAAAAQNDAALRAVFAQGCGNGFGIVGIIDGSLAVGADVKDFVVLFEQKGFRLFLQIKSRVI